MVVRLPVPATGAAARGAGSSAKGRRAPEVLVVRFWRDERVMDDGHDVVRVAAARPAAFLDEILVHGERDQGEDRVACRNGIPLRSEPPGICYRLDEAADRVDPA